MSNRHSVSLSTDFSQANHNPAIFLSPQALKNLKIPSDRQSPDHSNMLHLFNNYMYTDFTTAYKYFLIPSYLIRVI